MAQRTVVTLLDDLDQSPANETVEFGLDGVSYEIDLSQDHARALREGLGEFVEHARRTGGRRRTSAAGRSGPRFESRRHQHDGAGGRTGVDREQNQAIRQWARTQGMTVNERGRIPREITEAYHRAH
ncbi:histone-like nucleoid-structuring protein Lsr2 [Actinomycetospora lemnae]|uniref:Lsr2 family protein n=1 Tax=Actinomycetospora lemnae TaxID=3019891 RepID=A0ABT5T2F9_9PSEU|nr:Lsr2 family protein [Actinomycetospora sp. DW7H6]MDD7969310.1 Lsr2 family protein [Actinomycetospora sp. DW7H6]